MSFLDKVQFWKKHDDFSFDDSSTDLGITNQDPFASNNSGSDGLNLPPDPSLSGNSFDQGQSPSSMGGDNFMSGMNDDSAFSNSQDPLAPSSSNNSSFSTPNISNPDPFAKPVPPPSNFTENINSAQDSSLNQNPSLGQSLARNYIQGQNPSPNAVPSNNVSPASGQNSDLEILNLKLDTIKSEIGNMSQRLQRVEQLIVEQNKKRGW